MSLSRSGWGEFSCSLVMLELVASLVVDLSDQRLTVYNSDCLLYTSDAADE